MKVAICDDDVAYVGEVERPLTAFAAEQGLDMRISTFKSAETLTQISAPVVSDCQIPDSNTVSF